MKNQIETITLGFVNCYLITAEDGYILVDTGIAGMRENLEKKLLQSGCTPENLKLIIITHGDIDHTGNCKYLRNKYNAPIAMHKNDINMVVKAEFNDKREVNSKIMKVMNFIIKVNGGFKKMVDEFETFNPNIVFEDGQSLLDYGIDASIKHIPGHTDGSLAVLFKSGDLICGDTMQKNKLAIIVKNKTELVSSITKLSKSELNMIYPGHGKAFRWNENILKK